MIKIKERHSFLTKKKLNTFYRQHPAVCSTSTYTIYSNQQIKNAFSNIIPHTQHTYPHITSRYILYLGTSVFIAWCIFKLYYVFSKVPSGSHANWPYES